MGKAKKSLKARINSLRLFCDRGLVQIALHICTQKTKDKNVEIINDVSYGKSKLQKYDVQIPKNKLNALPVIFYVHGGSWCGGDKFGYTPFCSKLTKEGYAVVNINYRVMPKVGVKTTVSDCIRAIRHFLEKNKEVLAAKNIEATFDFNKCFFIGDSAGAHIVSLIAGKQMQKRLRLKINILGLGLYYGVYDFNNLYRDPSPVLTGLDKYWKSVEPDTKKLYSEISTTKYVNEQYPPCFLTSGEADKLHYQTEVFVNLLESYNIEMDYLSFPKTRQDGRHAFLNVPKLNSSKEAFNRLVIFFNKQLNKRENNGK